MGLKITSYCMGVVRYHMSCHVSRVVGCIDHQMLIFLSSIKSEAGVNSNVTKGLVPYMSTTSISLERVFPDSHISEVH